MEDRWLSVDEIEDYLGIKRDTVYKMMLRFSRRRDKINHFRSTKHPKHR